MGQISADVVKYCDIPYLETECGRPCSDHAAATAFGYPSAAAAANESEATRWELLHSEDDDIGTIRFSHLLEHAKMSVGLAYELAFLTVL